MDRRLSYLYSKLREIAAKIPLTADEKKKDNKRLLLIAEHELNHWLHAQLKSRPVDSWFVSDKIKLWSGRMEKCRRKDLYYKKLDKIAKAKKEGREIYIKPSFDIDSLKEASIVDVAKFYGFEIKRSGVDKVFIKLRSENTPSCCLNITGNYFHDFGSSDSGDVIDFVRKIERCDFKESCEKLISMGY